MSKISNGKEKREHDALRERPPALAPATGSANYVPVHCAICGHKDGLREDLVKNGVMYFYCDSCDDETQCVVDSPNDQAEPRGQRRE